MSSLPLWSESTDPSDTAGNIAIASRSSGRPFGNVAIAGSLVAPDKEIKERKMNERDNAKRQANATFFRVGRL